MTASMVGTLSRLGLLQALPGLDELGAPAMAVVAEMARERHYPARARLAGPLRASAVAHVVVEGELVLEPAGGKRHRVTAGQHVGWWTVLSDDAMDFELWTRRGAYTLALDREALLEIAEHSSHGFEVLHGLARSIANRLVQRSATRPGATVLRPDRVLDIVADTNTRTDERGSIGTVERILQMRRLPIFRGVNLDVVSRLAAAFEIRAARTGEPLSAADAERVVPLVLLRGRVRREMEGRIGDAIEAPALVGLPHALLGRRRRGVLRAADDAVALAVNIELLLDLAEDNADLALGLVTGLAARLRSETRTR